MKGVFINLNSNGAQLVCALQIVDLDNGIEYATYDSSRAQTTENAVEQLLHREQIVVGEALFVCYNPAVQKRLFDQIVSSTANLPMLWLDIASMYWVKFQLGHRDGSMPVHYGLELSEIAHALGINRDKYADSPLDGAKLLVDCYRLIVGWPNPAETHHGTI